MLYYENRSSDMMALKFRGPYHFPLHMQMDLEFIYVLEGSFTINTFNDQNFTVSKGELAVIFPHTVHGCTAPAGSSYYCGICPANISKHYKKILSTSHPANPIIPKEIVPEDIPSLFDVIADTLEIGDTALALAYFHLLTAKVIPLLDLKSNSAGYESSTVNRSVKYLSEHFTEDISLDSLAKHLGLNKYTVSHIFSDNIKTGFSATLNTFRIDMAKGLLNSTEKSVLDIALEVGYQNLRTFEIAFKKQTGVSPANYRKTQNNIL